MNILDKLIVKSFLRPFVPTLLIMVFLFLMQFIWKYIEDFAGKGIEWYYIAEMLFYSTAGVVPMALPIAVLLSSLMTVGDFGENYELAAMKSAGISLFRIMRPMMIIIFLLAIGAFFFYNNVIPVANLKSINLITNISKQKPSFNITPGVFYSGINGFSIKVGSKDENDGNKLNHIYIYDHSDSRGNTKVTLANQGEMKIVGQDEFLELTLKDGYHYENRRADKREERDNQPFLKSSFEKSIVRFSLKEFQTGDLRENNMKNFFMLNTDQLMDEADSLRENKTLRKKDFNTSFSSKYAFERIKNDTVVLNKTIESNYDFLAIFSKDMRKRAIQNALRMARSNREYLISTADEYVWWNKQIARHYTEWHKKFALSAACIVLFFIGAPLGAIIRKGGLGMPVVVSVVVFVLFHVLNMTFEKFGRELIWTPFWSIWMPTIILAPIGAFFTYRAATDSGLLSAEFYTNLFRSFKGYFIRKKKDA